MNCKSYKYYLLSRAEYILIYAVVQLRGSKVVVHRENQGPPSIDRLKNGFVSLKNILICEWVVWSTRR